MLYEAIQDKAMRLSMLEEAVRSPMLYEAVQDIFIKNKGNQMFVHFFRLKGMKKIEPLNFDFIGTSTSFMTLLSIVFLPVFSSLFLTNFWVNLQ